MNQPLSHDQKITIRQFKRLAARNVERAFTHPQGPILVHQMGKVGSTSIEQSLNQAGLGERTLHLHYLSGRLQEVDRWHRESGMVIPHLHILESFEVQKRLNLPDRPPMKLVSLVRDPVARRVSNLFQNLAQHQDDVAGEDGEVTPDSIAAWLRRTMADDHSWDTVFRWFDEEVKEVFHIDVFEAPLGAAPYRIYRQGKDALMLIRLEDLDDSVYAAIGEFVQSPQPLSAVLANQRSSGRDANTYRQVKSAVRIDQATLELVYESRFMRNFYTERQLQRFCRRWQGGGGAE